MNSYLLTFDSTQLDQAQWIGVVDAIDEIENWHAFFEGAIVVVSELDVKRLARIIQDRNPRRRFLLAELSRGKKEGWLPRPVWDFMNDPKPVRAA